MRNISMVIGFSVLALGLTSSSLPIVFAQAQAAPIPAEFSDLYSFLDEKFALSDAFVSSRWNGEKHDVTFSTELLAANGNQGEKLLTEQA
jgi:hypothetical protein